MVRFFLFSFVLLCFIGLKSSVLAKTITESPTLTVSLSKQSVWQREPVLVTLKIVTNDLLARLDSQEFTQDGLTIVHYELEQVEQENTLVLKLKWTIFPFAVGDHLLKFPRIRFRPNSGRPQKLDLPKHVISVKPLPIYVPPTMPVGNVILKNNWNNGWLVYSKDLLEWKIKAKSTQVAPATLPAISRQLHSSESLEILPIKRIIKTIKNDQEVSYIQSYQVPLKALTLGTLDFPKVSIQYFDPEIAKLRTTVVTPPVVMVLNKWILWFFVLVLVTLTIIITTTMYLKISGFYTRFRKKKASLLSLKQSTNYYQIREALRQFALAKGWDENTTLESFGNRSNKDVVSAIERLEKEAFSSSSHSVSKDDDADRQFKKIADELFCALR